MRLPVRVNRIAGALALLGFAILVVIVLATAAQAGAGFLSTPIGSAPVLRVTNAPTFLQPKLATRVTVDVAPRPVVTPKAAPVASGSVWDRLRRCESPDGRSSASGRYHGFFQFSQQTWASVGGSGNPGAASYDEQLKRAKILQARSGWGPWPACSRRLGLR